MRSTIQSGINRNKTVEKVSKVFIHKNLYNEKLLGGFSKTPLINKQYNNNYNQSFSKPKNLLNTRGFLEKETNHNFKNLTDTRKPILNINSHQEKFSNSYKPRNMSNLIKDKVDLDNIDYSSSRFNNNSRFNQPASNISTHNNIFGESKPYIYPTNTSTFNKSNYQTKESNYPYITNNNKKYEYILDYNSSIKSGAESVVKLNPSSYLNSTTYEKELEKKYDYFNNSNKYELNSGHSSSLYNDRRIESSRSKYEERAKSGLTESYKKSKLNEIQSYVGLSNIGNTCFMNTSLQLLLNCDEFIANLLSTPVNKKITGVTDVFKSFAKEYINSSSSSSYYKHISPRELKRVFKTHHRNFAGYNQQDSQEFLRILLEDISNETNTMKKGKFQEIKDDGKSKREIHEEYNRIYSENEKSVVTDYFNGELVNIFECENCGFENFSFQKVIDIPIYLRKKKRFKFFI